MYPNFAKIVIMVISVDAKGKRKYFDFFLNIQKSIICPEKIAKNIKSRIGFFAYLHNFRIEIMTNMYIIRKIDDELMDWTKEHEHKN